MKTVMIRIKTILEYLQTFLSHIFPVQCFICKRIAVFSTFICRDCFYELEIFLDTPVSFKYEENPCVLEVLCAYWFTPGLQVLAHHLKYKQADYIGRWLGERVGILTTDSEFNQTDAIVPIPLHPKRKRVRGYNQSEQIAIGISRIWDVPVVSDLTYRRVHTSTQTRLNREERQKNISGIFEVRKGKMIPESCVIVDDIFTTGATTCELARVLHTAGVKKIRILTLGTPLTHEGIKFEPGIDE
jgi:ComF family protein